MSTDKRSLKNYFLQIKRSPLLSSNKMKKKIKRVKSVNALREKQWDDRFIYDKIPLYDSKNDKNVLINLNCKSNSGNRKFGNKGINFPDNSLFIYRPLSNKTTMNHLFLNGKNNMKMPSAKSRDLNFRNENILGNKYKSFLEYGPNNANAFENYKKSENKNNIDSSNFNVINLINLNNIMKMWDELGVNKTYRKLFSVIYKELDDENKEELYKKETNEINKIKSYINDLKKDIENRIRTIQELYDLNVKLNTEIINKDNKCNEIILGEISEKINKLRIHTINVCKSMKKLKTELMFIQGLRLEKNAKLRVMCAIGLGELGVQNIGTLLISFFEDKDNFVKENIEKILLEKFNNNIAMNKILTYYKNDDKIVQRNALLECIKDIIQKMSVDYLFREFLEKLKMELS